MRIHSRIITEQDLHAATPPSTYLLPVSVHGSRSHGRAFECALRGDGARHTRQPNSGQYGADNGYAATYDDWGHWLARLFEIDPDAKMTYYANRDDFHRQTKNAYRVAVNA